MRRTEDPSLITGHGRYVGDITPEGTVHGFVVHSAMAHARISVSGLEEARSAPGVSLVLMAADVSDLGLMPTKAVLPQVDGTQHAVLPREILCSDTVRHVGEAIAFVVADSVEAAKLAAELIEIDDDPLDAIVDTQGALAPDAPLVWPICAPIRRSNSAAATRRRRTMPLPGQLMSPPSISSTTGLSRTTWIRAAASRNMTATAGAIR
ncbi:hypothetical protein [Breoghania sp.]|uniref:hypothetical protein n=1 Tax=Breoghania sp. TaxID=2065378 RepID=UPI0032049CCB